MDVFAVSHPAVPSSILALSRFIELHCFDSGVWLLIAERNAERGSTNTVGCKVLSKPLLGTNKALHFQP